MIHNALLTAAPLSTLTETQPLAEVAIGNEAWVMFEVISLIVLTSILVLDLLLVLKRPHVPSMKEATLWVLFYVTLALVFAGILWFFIDQQKSVEFVAGWLTEYSLSIDNLFVFVLIIGKFAVPKQYQQRVLMIGIIIALVLRAIFILLGAQLIASFSWVFYIFGVFLLWTAWVQAFSKESDAEQEDNRFIKFLKKRMSMTTEYNEGKLTVIQAGKKFFTPMLLVLLAIGTTDLMFAIDSIPAIFGITQDPFIVFTANLFALMGLRQLYFLLGGLLEKLVYLKYGIAAILAFIGVKLVFHALHQNELSFINGGEPVLWVPEIDTLTSLIVIIASMLVATVASLIKIRKDQPEGSLPENK